MLFDGFQLGNTTLNVTIDDRLPATYTVNGPMDDSVEFVESTFYIEYLTAQEEVDFQIHNITVEVIKLSSLPFIFRGFTYISFFDTLKDMPNLTEPAFPSPMSSHTMASHTMPTGRLSGTIIGSLMGVGLALLIIFMIKRRKQREKQDLTYCGIPGKL